MFIDEPLSVSSSDETDFTNMTAHERAVQIYCSLRWRAGKTEREILEIITNNLSTQLQLQREILSSIKSLCEGENFRFLN